MTADFVYQAEMGFTRKELVRGLATAVTPYQILDAYSEVIEIIGDNRTVKLSTGVERFRAIASMRIPVLPVKLEFFNFTDDAYSAFMQRFKKYLHKGGG